MAETPLQWARRSFAEIKTALSDYVVDESHFAVALEPKRPDGSQVRLRLIEDPVSPRLDVIKAAKDSQLPSLESGGPPRRKLISHRFDALDIGGGNFRWVGPVEREPRYGNEEIVTLIWKLL
jgi:hypothetical protein